MRNNILLLSTIYPKRNGNKGTSVCHYFAKEWLAMGYNVRVVHIQTVFPIFFYWISKISTKRIIAKTGAVVYTKRDVRENYNLDGIPVMFYPLFKFIPHGKYLHSRVKRMIYDIILENEQNNFVPDYILGHFLNPCIEVVSSLKEHYPNSLTSIISHGSAYQIHKIYGNKFYVFSKNIDSWGFRSRAIKDEFVQEVGAVENFYYCYSGVPENMLMDFCSKTFGNKLHSFVYVGEMISRKHPISVIQGLCKSYPNGNFHMTYIG